MRIGMMADNYKPYVSGITNYIALNKRYLEKAGHDVYVFTFSEPEHEDDDPRVIRSPGLPLADTGFYLSLRYSREAKKLLQTMDVVHVHHPFLSGPLALLYCRPRGIPIVFTNHTRYDLYAQAYLPAMPDIVGNAALQSYLPSFCRAVDLVISPSPGMREVLMQFGVDVPIEVVPNGVDLTPFAHPALPVTRAELGFQPEDIVLLFVGRLGPEKNLDFLLRSFTGATQAYDHLRLVLIGAGPAQEDLEDRVNRSGIQHAVRFMGPVAYDQMPRYMAMADAFVTASVTEVHPLSVIEAMASGLPVLTSSTSSLGEIAGDAAETIDPMSTDALADAIFRLATSADRRRDLAEKGLLRSRCFSWTQTAKDMLAVYHRAAGVAVPSTTVPASEQPVPVKSMSRERSL